MDLNLSFAAFKLEFFVSHLGNGQYNFISGNQSPLLHNAG